MRNSFNSAMAAAAASSAPANMSGPLEVLIKTKWYRAHAAVADARFGISLDDEQPDGLWQQSWPDDRGSKPPPDGVRQVKIAKTGSTQV